jgi:RND family efflux transporter MFP subunit
MKRSKGLSFFFLPIAILVACCSNKPVEIQREEKAIPVRAEHVELRRIGGKYAASGIVTTKKSATLSFRVPGFIESMAVNLGDFVPARTVIARLDPRDYLSEVELAEAALEGASLAVESARSDFQRISGLHDEKMISRQDFDQSATTLKLAETALAEARTKLDLARRRLSYAELAVPYDCSVIGTQAQEGEFVSTGSPVVSICSLDPLAIEIGVPESEIVRVSRHDKASATFSSFPKAQFSGTVTSIGASADPMTRTFPVEITIENFEKKIKPGMVAWVELSLSHAKEAVTIPLVAVVKNKIGQPVAFVVDDETERAEARRIELGQAFAKEVEIVSGLTVGEKIVVDGQHYLGDGQKIRVIEEAKQAT